MAAHSGKAMCVGFLVTASLYISAQGDPEDNAARTIRALEHAWVEGQARNDNGALDLIFDEALVYVEYGKLMTKGEYLARVKAAGPGPAQIALEALTVRTLGDTAIVVGSYREKAFGSGKAVKRWRFVDTWVNKKGQWVLVSAAASPLLK